MIAPLRWLLARWVKPEVRPESVLGTIGAQRELIGERVPHETRFDAVARVERRLEGQQTKNSVAGARDVVHAPLPPRPHLRTDVLHRAQTRRLQAARES